MAISFTKYVKRFARISVAFGLAAALSATGASAANRTWVGTGYSGFDASKWGTSFASNWSPATVPTASDDVYFGTSAQYTVFLNNSTAVRSMSFTSSGTAAYTVASLGSYDITLGGGLAGGKVIVSDNPQAVVISSALKMTSLGSTRYIDGSGGPLTISSLDINSSDVAMSGSKTTTINSLVGSGATSKFQNNNGSTTVAAGSGVRSYVVSGGSLTFGDVVGLSTGTSTLLVTGGTFSNGGYSRSLESVSVQGGAVSLNSLDTLNLSGAYSQDTGGEIQMTVASLSDYSKVVATGTVGFAGTLSLDFNTLGAVSEGNSWNLFNKGSGSAATTVGNFDTVDSSLTTVGSYAGLSWTQDNQEWKSTSWNGHDYFVFLSQNGTLVVVPEPSTYAMGMIGVATAGFMRWRSRRRRAADAATTVDAPVFVA